MAERLGKSCGALHTFLTRQRIEGRLRLLERGCPLLVEGLHGEVLRTTMVEQIMAGRHGSEVVTLHSVYRVEVI